LPELDDRARSQIQLIDQEVMRCSIAGYINDFGVSPEIMALSANISITTFKRWLAGETNVQATTIRRLVEAFPDMGERLGLSYDYGPMKQIPILGECYSAVVQPLAPAEKTRYLHLPQSVDRHYMNDWFAVIINAPTHNKWRGATVILDCNVKIVEIDEFMDNQSYMLLERDTGKLYIGWVEPLDFDEGVRLLDGSGNVVVEQVLFEYAHPSIGYLFNTSTIYGER
jgi:hypothetical protein